MKDGPMRAEPSPCGREISAPNTQPHSVFVTGPRGAGKTRWLRRQIHDLAESQPGTHCVILLAEEGRTRMEGFARDTPVTLGRLPLPCICCPSLADLPGTLRALVAAGSADSLFVEVPAMAAAGLLAEFDGVLGWPRELVVCLDRAVAAVSRCLRSALAGLKAPNRPVGVFLFMGPSGVGKTKLAKELTRFLFGTDEALVRFDMSEYQEKYAISNLVGSPRGYIGSEQPGLFSEALRRRPYSVVLLDEIEKAHSDVFNLFLSVFDEGRTTDNQGRMVDCSNAIFILTSNLGVERRIGFAGERGEDLRAVAMQFFRPELVNRITEAMQFLPLGRTELALILDQILAEKTAAFQSAQGITLTLEDEAKDFILSRDFDPRMGARPLERVVDQMVVQPLVDAVFSKQVGRGKIRIIPKGGKLAFVS